MLKISKIAAANDEVILRLEGRVIGDWVAELRDVCADCLSNQKPYRLNLADVDFVDHAGLTLLLELRSSGVPLDNCSAFLREQLKKPNQPAIPSRRK